MGLGGHSAFTKPVARGSPSQNSTLTLDIAIKLFLYATKTREYAQPLPVEKRLGSFSAHFAHRVICLSRCQLLAHRHILGQLLNARHAKKGEQLK